jgi:hypothetical protein
MKPICFSVSLLIILVLGTSCQKTEGLQNLHSHMTLSDLKSQFRHQDLTKFDLDTFSWDSRHKYYTELDSVTFPWVWQDSTKQYQEKDVRHFLYSWQQRDSNFIELTILTQDGIDDCLNTTYFIYDRQGKAIDNFVLNSSCKEDGWDFQEYGKFINHNTYEKVCVETDENNAGNQMDLIEGDSTVYHFTIGDDGKVNESEVSRKHFKYKIPAKEL